MKEHDIAALRVYLMPVEQANIHRGSDLLYDDDMSMHEQEVKAAILEELRT